MTPRNMPLPLELTKPVLLAGDLDTQFRAGLVADYDPETQLCGGRREGGCGGGGSRSSQESKSNSGVLVIDVTLDLQIDDNNF